MIQEKASITISDKVFDKIKILCNKYNRVEWSGIIWMNLKGTVEDPATLEVNIVDFTLLDIGSPAYTEFEISPEIIMPIYNKYPEYITMKYGCIHSHNNMGVFFSGTDTSTLLEQAFIHNFFVSVIVNNNFDKIAKISYQGKRTIKGKITETFFNRIGKILLPYTKVTEENTEEDVVYVIDCNVNYESELPVDEELNGQIELLEKREEEKKKKATPTYSKGYNNFEGYNHFDNRDFNKDFRSQPYQRQGVLELGTGWLEEESKAEKIKYANASFDMKCENFIKRLICIDYLGSETENISLTGARKLHQEDYADSEINEFLEEVKDFCDDLFPTVFEKELEKNWFEETQFKKLKMMLASQFSKLLDISNPVEKGILEIVDHKLKETEDERTAEFEK